MQDNVTLRNPRPSPQLLLKCADRAFLLGLRSSAGSTARSDALWQMNNAAAKRRARQRTARMATRTGSCRLRLHNQERARN
eukprot:scaffold273210_cov27-Tisochrysis_lutea.AAC.4